MKFTWGLSAAAVAVYRCPYGINCYFSSQSRWSLIPGRKEEKKVFIAKVLIVVHAPSLCSCRTQSPFLSPWEHSVKMPAPIHIILKIKKSGCEIFKYQWIFVRLKFFFLTYRPRPRSKKGGSIKRSDKCCIPSLMGPHHFVLQWQPRFNQQAFMGKAAFTRNNMNMPLL